MLQILAKDIEKLIQDRHFADIKKLLPGHPEDMAVLFSQLSAPSAKLFILRMIPPDRAVDVVECLPAEDQEELLKSLTSEEVANILNEMSPDDRTELFEEMPVDLAKKFINYLSPSERTVTLKLLNYPEDTVGRLITPDFVQLFEDMTVEDAIAHMREVGVEKETIYHGYVLDREKTLKGVVSLKRIVLAAPHTKIKEIMFPQVIKVKVTTDQEEAANIFKKYDLIALPVVDHNDKLLGIVTFDDLVDVLEDEVTEDFEKIAAVLPIEETYMEAGFFSLVWKRSFWLIVLAVFESISGFILQRYGTAISQWIELTFFLPVLVAAAGNAGTQSATIVIRSLATGDIAAKDFLKVIARESLLGVAMGVILAVVGVIRVFFQQQNWLVSFSVGISMGVTIMIAVVVGASLPIISRKLKSDPAVMSGPLITTIVDVVGIFIYFEIAKAILNI